MNKDLMLWLLCRAVGGVQVLKDTVARGKRRLVPPEVAKAASDALLQCM